MSDEKYSTSIAGAVQEINRRKEDGEEIDPLTLEGLRAVEFANNIVNSLMRKNKVDLAYFKAYVFDAQRRIDSLSKKEKAPEKKSRSLRRKRSSRNRVSDVNKTS